MKIFSPEQITELEDKIIKEFYISQDILMENAAHAVYRVVIERFKNFEIVILCGPGNNGGDGLALARILNSEGWNVSLSYLYKPDYNEPSLRNYNSVRHIKVIEIENINLSDNTLIIDALFGIGLNRELDMKTTSVINKINNSTSRVLSIDIPTGINGLYGTLMGSVVIKADLTVTFLSYKLGHFLYPGAEYCGEIIVSPISVPIDAYNGFITPYINIPLKLSNRARNSHKGSNGKILTIAGSAGYYGAPFFSSKASLLAGAGYSALVTPLNIARVCAVHAPEVIYKEDKELVKLVSNSTSVVFGPGVGINSRSKKLLNELVKNQPENLIIDADGITLLAKTPSLIQKLKKLFVITPHPGEMGVLINKTVKEIESNRIKFAKEVSVKFNCIVVLKGVYTIIATPNKEVYINIKSSVTLSTSGSGDILCGIIAGLTSFTDLLSAVRSAVYIHGLAGVIAEKKYGKDGIISSDILELIPEALKKYKQLT